MHDKTRVPQLSSQAPNENPLEIYPAGDIRPAEAKEITLTAFPSMCLTSMAIKLEHISRRSKVPTGRRATAIQQQPDNRGKTTEPPSSSWTAEVPPSSNWTAVAPPSRSNPVTEEQPGLTEERQQRLHARHHLQGADSSRSTSHRNA
ncbi:hypothetical protein ALC53_06202 [Atta colombica]|uniref:Uncharacterized protein n=1 Tax=Atta colombica TaxID=520822 RepID=A0A195BGM6_9HYME|nr:hypothetical protein ALC53_06202 [Atta colombica]